MAIQEIKSNKVDGKLTVTIDNETIPIEVEEIIKKQTQFVEKNTLDNVLYNPIIVKLSLISYNAGKQYEAINDQIINAEEYVEDFITTNDYVERGIITFTIKDNNNKIYDKKTIFFDDGENIQITLTNELPIGEYILIAEYEGNQYYAPTNLQTHFNISKRKIKCIFEEDILSAYPDETFTSNIQLKDVLNDKVIGNCAVYYNFNGNDYITQTNGQGVATITLTMPSIDPSKCSQHFDSINTDIDTSMGEYYWDDDGNLQPIEENEVIISNEVTEEQSTDRIYMYPVNVFIDNNIYTLDEAVQYIMIKKYDTNILLTNNSYLNEQWHIEGYVFDSENKDALYGDIEFSIIDVNYTHQSLIPVNKDGTFAFDINTSNVINIVSDYNPSSTPLICSPPQNVFITLNDIPAQITRNYVKKHGINCVAYVETLADNKPVIYGMVTFIISKDEKEIYRYVTELNDVGEAYFIFDVSTIGEYNVQAFYHSIFEYKDNKSDIKTYEIIEEE